MKTIALCLGLCILGACTTVPVGERAGKRDQIDQTATRTVAEVIAKDSSLQAEMDAAVGYFAGSVSSVSALIVGGGVGFGVLVDNQYDTRTYMNIQRLDLGAGLGARSYRLLAIFSDPAMLERFRSGKWELAAAADVSAGATGGTAVPGSKGYSFHIIADQGAIATMSARAGRISVNHDLTDTGISEITIPNRGFDTPDGESEGPRRWDRKLPFLAQKAVDAGFDLPLPVGTGLIYAYTDQKQLIDELEIGFDGSEKVPLSFVTFDDARSISDSGQARLDFWLLPFMNIFAMIGHVEGDAPITFTLDGDSALEDIGEECLGPPPPLPPVCQLFQGNSVTVDFDATFTGTTYGIGTVLAAGWKSFFVAVPASWTYADMEGTETEGTVTTITPRAGKLFSLGRAGNLALFAGGQYLKSRLEVTGNFEFEGTDFSVDYKVRQRNKDPWVLLLGGNWNFNKHWSWSMEYDGFIGSRESFITSINLRF